MGNSNSDLLYNFKDDIEIVRDGEDCVVERKAKGVYREGEYVKPTNKAKSFFARCSVQPASGDTILEVSENDRTRQIFTVFSNFAFQKDDILIRDEKRYEIQSCHDWNVYTESVAVLIDVQ